METQNASAEANASDIDPMCAPNAAPSDMIAEVATGSISAGSTTADGLTNTEGTITEATIAEPVATEPKPSYVKLAMRNMVRKRGLSLKHFALTTIGLLAFLVGLSYLTR